MQRIFLESSAIAEANRLSLDAAEACHHLERCGYSPVLGLHVVYEMAGAFLHPELSETGKAHFRFIRDLDPSLSPETWNLLEQELLKLRTNAAVLPFLNHANRASTRYEIHRLAEGVFDNTARSFISSHEAKIKQEYPRMVGRYLDHLKERRAAMGNDFPPLRTFEDVRKYFADKTPEMIGEILRGNANTSETREIAARIDQFPVIRTTVGANLYMMYICIVHGVAPGDGKIDDYRHLIDASYSDAYISYDEKLVRAQRHIAPSLRLARWQEL